MLLEIVDRKWRRGGEGLINHIGTNIVDLVAIMVRGYLQYTAVICIFRAVECATIFRGIGPHGTPTERVCARALFQKTNDARNSRRGAWEITPNGSRTHDRTAFDRSPYYFVGYAMRSGHCTFSYCPKPNTFYTFQSPKIQLTFFNWKIPNYYTNRCIQIFAKRNNKKNFFFVGEKCWSKRDRREKIVLRHVQHCNSDLDWREFSDTHQVTRRGQKGQIMQPVLFQNLQFSVSRSSNFVPFRYFVKVETRAYVAPGHDSRRLLLLL